LSSFKRNATFLSIDTENSSDFSGTMKTFPKHGAQRPCFQKLTILIRACARVL